MNGDTKANNILNNDGEISSNKKSSLNDFDLTEMSSEEESLKQKLLSIDYSLTNLKNDSTNLDLSNINGDDKKINANESIDNDKKNTNEKKELAEIIIEKKLDIKNNSEPKTPSDNEEKSFVLSSQTSIASDATFSNDNQILTENDIIIDEQLDILNSQPKSVKKNRIEKVPKLKIFDDKLENEINNMIKLGSEASSQLSLDSSTFSLSVSNFNKNNNEIFKNEEKKSPPEVPIRKSLLNKEKNEKVINKIPKVVEFKDPLHLSISRIFFLFLNFLYNIFINLASDISEYTETFDSNTESISTNLSLAKKNLTKLKKLSQLNQEIISAPPSLRNTQSTVIYFFFIIFF